MIFLNGSCKFGSPIKDGHISKNGPYLLYCNELSKRKKTLDERSTISIKQIIQNQVILLILTAQIKQNSLIWGTYLIQTLSIAHS